MLFNVQEELEDCSKMSLTWQVVSHSIHYCIPSLTILEMAYDLEISLEPM